MPKLLKLAAYEDAILRNPTAVVTFPLSKEDKILIADMKYSIHPQQLKKANAPWEAAVGMAANQWGVAKQIFLFCPEGDAEKGLEVIINPRYEPVAEQNGKTREVDDWEGCFSIPLATGHIRRYHTIRVTYQNEKGEKLTKELSGWAARVWQHENDHLFGFLYDDPRTRRCLVKNKFLTREEVDNFYNQIRERRKKL